MKQPGCVFCTLPKQTKDKEHLILGRSKHTFAIMNKFPYNSGHIMLVPFAHTDTLTTLSEDELLDLQRCIRDGLEIMGSALNPHGFNVGMNLGEAGGAGIRDHVHYHVVPRWSGDTNYMPVFAETKVLPESIEETYDRLIQGFTEKWADRH